MKKRFNPEKIKGLAAISSLLLIWALLITVGSYLLLVYEYTAGGDKNFPSIWPAKSKMKLAPSGYTLVMMVHPKCECSKASIGELSKLVARLPNVLHAKVIFITQKDRTVESDNPNWIAAHEIPGTEVLADQNGEFANLFHLQTSGITLLYDQSGKLIFGGGITAARGHWGDNLGSQAIHEIITSGSSPIKTTGVFGCSLFKKR